MTLQEIHSAVTAQRTFFAAGETRSLKVRKKALCALKTAILQNEDAIVKALQQDLGKGGFESYMCEIGMVLEEIGYMLKHINRFAKAKHVRTPMAHFAAHSFTLPVPYGTVLIMGPWNYPFLLTLEPLVDALAAGNTVVLKPSAYSSATSACIKRLLESVFPPEYVTVITGGREENACLLDEKFDKIFFTGSREVGREVMQKASRHLTPVTLELGGKSPCIVDETANIPMAARRIVFGKYLNCGQTCVAPDYVLCHTSVKDRFLAAVKEEILKQYGEDPLSADDYGRIINQKHFDRILSLIDPKKVVHGGESDGKTLRIAPTVMDGVLREDAVMGEEIFGPVLPILTYESLDAVISDINSHDKPLALYLFSSDRHTVCRVTQECAYGGGCINDCVVHLATTHMGFGGVGESGMGSYHGKDGFDAFSHRKSILDKKTFPDLSMRYRPYSKQKARAVRNFMK